jgi:hypothetical protein
MSKPVAALKFLGLLPMAALIFCLHVFGAVWALLGDWLPSGWDEVQREWEDEG